MNASASTVKRVLIRSGTARSAAATDWALVMTSASPLESMAMTRSLTPLKVSLTFPASLPTSPVTPAFSARAASTPCSLTIGAKS